MNIARKEKKEQAIYCMKTLNIYKPYIDSFTKKDQVCFFENFGGFWVDKELKKKIKEIEDKHNCLVYAITHEFTELGEMYDFLIVPDYKEDFDDMLIELNKNTFYVLAWVWNKSDYDCSEFGTIAVRSYGGGIKRVG